MLLKSLTISNFRSFGKETIIALSDCSSFIGSNGAGKSAALHALLKLFGTTSGERNLNQSDFHIPTGVDPDTINEQKLYIEARIEFPELAGTELDPAAIPDFYSVLIVDAPEAAPYCRIRLEGTWTRSNLPEGDVEEQLHWMTTPAGAAVEPTLQKVKPHERNAIHVIYVPAVRDPAKQLKSVASGTILRLLQSVPWKVETQQAIASATADVDKALQAEGTVKELQDAVARTWASVHDVADFQKPRLRAAESKLPEVIRGLSFVFSTLVAESDLPVARMSEGLKSLFYLTLVTAVFEYQHKLAGAGPKAVNKGDEQRDETPPPPVPLLTIFAVEEPENHVAPHYLARIMDVLQRQAKHPAGQVILTSHSASILSRVAPRDVRHFRLDVPSLTTCVRQVDLPASDDEAFVYVNEAVRAYPELYFARFVVLCEGDSEQIVLPRIGKLLGTPMDRNLVSVVPLGGRHVNHFWKLLSGLKIPFCTLGDLDWGRRTGGWDRIVHLLSELLINGADSAELLVNSDGTVLAATDWQEALVTQGNVDPDRIYHWLSQLQKFGVFLSSPLDVDWLMLQAFTTEYQTLDANQNGPQLPDPSEEEGKLYAARLEKASIRIFGERGSSAGYPDGELFPWYSYLFLDRSKPRTHFASVNRITKERLEQQLPQALKDLIAQIQKHLPTTPTVD